MFNALTALGWGVVTFGVTIGVGIVVVTKFGDTIATCAGGFTYNSSSHLCSNGTAAVDASPTNSAWVTTDYVNTQLGSTSGLASWSPAIVAFAVGMLFLGAFLVRRGGNRSY